MPIQKWQRRAPGFTLVELLVVVGIITVLIAMLMPALSRARSHALRVTCQSNLRSIGQAMTMYVQQYGYYPGCELSLQVSPGGWQAGPALWPIRLRAYTGGDQDVFYCAAQDERCQWKKNAAGVGPRATAVHARFGYDEGERLLELYSSWFSYGYNAWGRSSDTGSGYFRGLGFAVFDNPSLFLANVGTPIDRRRYAEVPASRVRKPSELIAVTDANADGWNDFLACPDPTILDGKVLPGAVHDKGSNALFCDGHVEWYLRKELTNIYGAAGGVAQMRRMWDVEHQP